MDLPSGFSITWLGHSAFRIKLPDGRVLLTDPWLENPMAPPDAKNLGRIDAILVSHGHFDHLGQAADVARQTGARAISIFEIASWLQGQGVAEEQAIGMNKGGTVDLGDGLRVTLVHAQHSSGISGEDGLVEGGEAAGFVVRVGDGFTFYHAGDTNVNTEMRLISELYKPQLGFLPIGGHFTMSPFEAAHAARMLGLKAVMPMHYGTFPVLSGTPAQLRKELDGSGIEVLELQPGQTLG